MYKTSKQGKSKEGEPDSKHSVCRYRKRHSVQVRNQLKANIKNIKNKMMREKSSFNFKSKLLFVVGGNTDAGALLAFCEMQQILANVVQGSGHKIYWSLPGLGSVIGLSRSRLDLARHLLRKSGVLVEKKHGWPAKLELHIDLDLLEKQLTSSIPELAECEEITVNQEILNFAGKNLHAALMLSYGMNRQKHANETLPAEKFGIYWPMQQKEWYQLLGLKRRKQESARKVLRETGCWKERQWGWPARNEFHLDLDRLMTISPRLANASTGV